MENINALYANALEMVRNAGIAIPAGLNARSVGTMNRQGTYGICRTRKLGNGKMTHEIKLHKDFVITGTKEGITNTLVHEILHACANEVDFKCAHKGKWLEYANRMNRKYGLNIAQRNWNHTENGDKIRLEKPVRAIIKCTKCGKEYKYHRIGKYVNNYTQYKCGYCNGELTRIM